MTTSPLESAHPSYLALDRAALGTVSSEVRAHLAGCAECSSYLQGLAGAPAESGVLELRRRVEQRRTASLRRWWALLPAAAAMGLLFVALPPGEPRDRSERPYLGAKGFPSVWIYVKHGSGAQLWDGKQPLFVGDQLRLKVDPARFRHVEVYSLRDVAAPERLYAGEVRPAEIVTLPDAWELDAEPGLERLVVVLSDGPVTPSWPDWLHGKTAPGVSVLPFELPKAARSAPSDEVP